MRWLITSAIILLNFSVAVSAIAESIHPERPKSVAEITLKASQTACDVLDALVNVSVESDYKSLGRRDCSNGYFEAVREESETVHHRVVIWIEWNLSQPGKVVRVYIKYAKLKKYKGSVWKKLSADEKENAHNIQHLIRDINEFSRKNED